MTTCIDHPKRASRICPREANVIFPFRNPGLKIQPPSGPIADADSSATKFSFKALPCRRPAERGNIELNTFCHGEMDAVFSAWKKCASLPCFMRAVTGPCDTDANSWSLRLREEEVPWEAVTTEEILQKRIAWWSTGSRTHRNRGSVCFELAGRKTVKVSLAIEFYESVTSAVTEGTLRSLRAALDHCLDLLQLQLTPGTVLGPCPASL